MKTILMYLPTAGTVAQITKGMAGTNTQNYQNMLRQVGEQIKFADEIGIWGASFTEHHLHIEGFEISNSPTMLALYFGQQTKNIRMGQLANVISRSDPLRVAEEAAMLDQMLRGRSFFGMARGYHERWGHVFNQGADASAATFDAAANEKRHRRMFDEHYEIIKKAWTQDVFSHKGENWTIPPEGINLGHPAVAEFGKGQGADGNITDIGIAPKTFQRPHPPIFMPFSFSIETFRFCAREGIIPLALSTDDETISDFFNAYTDEAAKSGFNYAPGQNLGILRDLLVLESSDEAHHFAAMGNGFVWPRWFAPLGFNEAFRVKGQTGPMPKHCDYAYLRETGFGFVGSPDEVNRKIERMVKRHGVEYLIALQHSGPIPHHVQMRSLELYATEVMPNWT